MLAPHTLILGCSWVPVLPVSVNKLELSKGKSIWYNILSFADDKYNLLVTKGDTPARQTRERISTSSSVRDRSALYLSRAAAIDSTGSSTQPVSSWNASHSSSHAEVKILSRESVIYPSSIQHPQCYAAKLSYIWNADILIIIWCKCIFLVFNRNSTALQKQNLKAGR